MASDVTSKVFFIPVEYLEPKLRKKKSQSSTIRIRRFKTREERLLQAKPMSKAKIADKLICKDCDKRFVAHTHFGLLRHAKRWHNRDILRDKQKANWKRQMRNENANSSSDSDMLDLGDSSDDDLHLSDLNVSINDEDEEAVELSDESESYGRVITYGLDLALALAKQEEFLPHLKVPCLNEEELAAAALKAKVRFPRGDDDTSGDEEEPILIDLVDDNSSDRVITYGLELAHLMSQREDFQPVLNVACLTVEELAEAALKARVQFAHNVAREGMEEPVTIDLVDSDEEETIASPTTEVTHINIERDEIFTNANMEEDSAYQSGNISPSEFAVPRNDPEEVVVISSDDETTTNGFESDADEASSLTPSPHHQERLSFHGLEEEARHQEDAILPHKTSNLQTTFMSLSQELNNHASSALPKEDVSFVMSDVQGLSSHTSQSA